VTGRTTSFEKGYRKNIILAEVYPDHYKVAERKGTGGSGRAAESNLR